tara:strand:+ start:90 stop:860 length:771 start_codon:yes stop_codon:yes gene_type:complete
LSDDEWKNDPLVHSISDEMGKTMWFRLSPAKNNPQNAPFFLILHGHGTTSRPTFYSEKNWNIIAPMDNFGFESKGSWWLGEDGGESTRMLLKMVVEAAKEIIDADLDSKLCIYGSSMGGYGAILNAQYLGATAVYANVPQIHLLGSTYSELGMKPYFQAVLGQQPDDIHNNLCNYIRGCEGEHPLYFICENRFGQRNYLSEQAMTIVSTFNELNINYHLEIVPTTGHNKNLGLREVRALFEKHIEELNYLLEDVNL